MTKTNLLQQILITAAYNYSLSKQTTFSKLYLIMLFLGKASGKVYGIASSWLALEFYEITPHTIFLTPPNILRHIFLTATPNCLQFGIHRVHKHLVFITKFGINRLY